MLGKEKRMSCAPGNLSYDSSCTPGFLSSGAWSSAFSFSEVWHSLATCILPSQIPRQRVSLCHSVTLLSKRWLSWADLLHVSPNCSLLLGCCTGGRRGEDAVYVLLSPASFSTSSFRFLTSLTYSFVFVLYVQVHNNLNAVMHILNRLYPLVWIQLYWNTFSCNSLLGQATTGGLWQHSCTHLQASLIIVCSCPEISSIIQLSICLHI